MIVDALPPVKVSTAILTRLGSAGRAGRIVAPKLDLIREIGPRAMLPGGRTFGEEDNSWGPAVRRVVYRQLWSEAAERLGARCRPLVDDYLQIRRGEVQTVVWYHTVMLDFGVTLQLALDKVAVHHLLTEAGIPMARYTQSAGTDLRGMAGLLAGGGGSVVVKPARSTSGGEGVTCGVRTPDEYQRACIWARRWDSEVLVEEQIRGTELRLLFLDGELIDVLLREAPSVVGDGRSTVLELIRRENRRRADPANRAGLAPLSVDLDCFFTLKRADLTISSIPAAGRAVTVKSAVNQSGSQQVRSLAPHEIGPALVADAGRAVAALGLRFAGVDLITPDPQRSLIEAGGVVIEVNGTPGLHYHYLVDNQDEAVPVAVPLLAALLDPARNEAYRQFR